MNTNENNYLTKNEHRDEGDRTTNSNPDFSELTKEEQAFVLALSSEKRSELISALRFDSLRP